MWCWSKPRAPRGWNGCVQRCAAKPATNEPYEPRIKHDEQAFLENVVFARPGLPECLWVWLRITAPPGETAHRSNGALRGANQQPIESSMLFYFSQFLQQQAAGTAWAEFVSPLRVFRYVTFRSAGAAITALLLSLWLGPKVIAWLKQLKFGQHYSDKAEEGGGLAMRVLSKRGTPTMGGILIVLVLDLAVLLWAQLNALILLTLLSLIVLAGLGFYDDYMKITQQNSRGTRSRVKLWVQFALALFIGVYLWLLPETKNLITEVM